MNIEHQYDCKGSHRIVIDGEVGSPSLYAHIASMEKGGKWYMAVTPYYEGTLPREMCEGVFVLARVGDDAEAAAAYNFFSLPEDEPCPWVSEPDRGEDCPLAKCPQKERR